VKADKHLCGCEFERTEKVGQTYKTRITKPCEYHGGGSSKGFHPEPPVGTWMRDRFGGSTQRQAEGWGQPGMMPFGKWEAMWEARGPYVECGPWGRDL
jgi:hypothetical protein